MAYQCLTHQLNKKQVVADKKWHISSFFALEFFLCIIKEVSTSLIILRDIGVCSKIPLYRIGAWTILSYNSNTIRMAMLLHTAIYLGIHENGKFTGCRKWDMAFVMMWACGYSRLEVGADREKGPTTQTQVVRCIVEYCRDHTGTLVWSMTSSASRTR